MLTIFDVDESAGKSVVEFLKLALQQVRILRLNSDSGQINEKCTRPIAFEPSETSYGRSTRTTAVNTQGWDIISRQTRTPASMDISPPSSLQSSTFPASPQTQPSTRVFQAPKVHLRDSFVKGL